MLVLVFILKRCQKALTDTRDSIWAQPWQTGLVSGSHLISRNFVLGLVPVVLGLEDVTITVYGLLALALETSSCTLFETHSMKWFQFLVARSIMITTRTSRKAVEISSCAHSMQGIKIACCTSYDECNIRSAYHYLLRAL